jgi:hypothetical protein
MKNKQGVPIMEPKWAQKISIATNVEWKHIKN